MVSNTLVADDPPTNLATVQQPPARSGAPLFVATSSHAITWCVGRRAAAILLGDNHGR
jgi:hypothetical protein